MKLPETLKISPFVYRVELVTKLLDTEHCRNYGICDTNHLTIRLDDENNDQQMRQTLLHEVIHAINNHGRLGLEEDTVERLTNGLLAFLLDNDWLRDEPPAAEE